MKMLIAILKIGLCLAAFTGIAASEHGQVILEKGSDNWRYVVVDAGHEPARKPEGSKWYRESYDDSTWKSAVLPLGYGHPRLKTSELSRTGTYFLRRTFELPVAPDPTRDYLLMEVASDESANIYINGTMVESPPRSARYGEGDKLYWSRRVAVSASVLKKGRNLLAIHLRKAVTTSSAFIDVRLSLQPLPAPGKAEASEADSGPSFHVPLDRSSDGLGRDYVWPSDTYVYLAGKGNPPYEKGIVDDTARLGATFLSYPLKRVINAKKGTLSFWIRLTDLDVVEKEIVRVGRYGKKGRGTDWAEQLYPVYAGDALKFNVDEWPLLKKSGEWHNVVITWDREKGERTDWFDGRPGATHKIPVAVDEPRMVFFGYWKLSYKFRLWNPMVMDEIYAWDRVLSKEEIGEACERTRAGKTSWPESRGPHPGNRRLWPVDRLEKVKDRQALPGKIDWDITGDVVATNEFRTRYSLNGFWRVQPAGLESERIEMSSCCPVRSEFPEDTGSLLPDPGNWGYVELPLRNYRSSPRFYDPAFSRKTDWPAVSIKDCPVVWIERDVFVPSEWKSKQVMLTLEGVYRRSQIYVNGIHVGEIFPWQIKSLCLTPHVRCGETNRITIGSGGPVKPVYLAGHHTRLNWGLSHDAFLDVIDSREAMVHWALAIPSVAENRITFDLQMENFTPDTMPAGIGVEVRGVKAENESGNFKTREIRLEPGFTRSCPVTWNWDDARLWKPEDPFLYKAVFTLYDRNGVPIDRSYPVRFGFREINVRGRELRLNGCPITLRSVSHNLLSGPTDPAGYAKTLDFFSSIGMNCHRTTHPKFNGLLDQCLDVADEHGFLVQYCYRTPPDSSQLWPDYFNTFATFVRRFGNNPSLALWQFFSVSAAREAYQYHPRTYQVPKKVPAEYAQRRDRALELKAGLKKIDPTRPVFYYTGGEGGDLASCWFYKGMDVPLQSKEEWCSAWAETDAPPIFNAECALIHHAYFFNWQLREGLDHPRSAGPRRCMATPVLVEWAAMLLGDRAYEECSRELVASLGYKPAERAKYWPRKYPAFWEIKRMYAKRRLCSWRTYGMSFSLHIEHQYCHDRKGNLTPQGEAFQTYNMPLLAYIGGPPGDFVLKDHAFIAGEEVNKQIVIRNDYQDPIDLDVEWRLVLADGKQVEHKTFKHTFEPGVTMLPLSFKAPSVDRKNQYTLLLRVKNGENVKEDRFDIEVFPESTMPAVKGKIALVDDSRDASSLLKKAGVDFDILAPESDLEKYSLVVIGRGSYTPGTAALLDKLGVDAAIGNGLNVLVMEQTSRYVMGLKMDDPSLREVFVCDSDNPILKGLDDRDLHDWRGASDLIEAYPEYNMFPDYTKPALGMHGFFGEREFWHWSNKGIVSTLMFEKPQRGNFRILLEAGYDLGYTPLVEWFKGKGRVMLCQLDVSNRYGVDPVATRIVNRMLIRMSGSEGDGAPGAGLADNRDRRVGSTSRDALKERTLQGDATCGKACLPDDGVPAVFIGKQNDKLFKDLGVKIKQADNLESALGGASVLVVDPTSIHNELMKKKQEMRSFLERGGRLFVLPAESEQQLAWLPVPVRLEKKPVWKTSPNLGITAGLGMSDFFWREVKEIPVVMPGEGVKTVDSGVVGEMRHGKGCIVLCQVSPDMFDDSRAWTKTLRVLSALLTNLGVDAASPCLLDKELDGEESPYAKPWITFNPYEYTGW